MTEPDVQWMEERLAPEFEVIRLIGAGGVSQVFLARETGLDRLVAIKVLRRALAADDTASRRFDREARSVARISHPHVASVYRVGRVDDLPYLVMEYIEGRTLADLLDGGTRFDEEETVSALTHIAAALSAAHAQRVLHRDVRPANVMRETRTGRFVLTDFGIAGVMESGAAVTRLTAIGEVLGDPSHVSPEQLRGESLTDATDVYSLGVMGYEMLTGEGPFGSGTLAQMTVASLQEDPRRLEDLRSGTTPGLARLLERCLSKRPEQRPSASRVEATLRSGNYAEAPTVDESASSLARFLDELRTRKVYKVGAGYLAISYIVLEVASIVLPEMPLPAWTFTAVVAIAVGGFPVALALSWSFDLSRSGIQRAESWSGDRPGRGKERLIQAAALTLSLALMLGISWWILSN